MNVQLLNGDCLEIMRDIPDKSVDMILCDLLYGTTACSWDVVIPFDKLWEQYNRIVKDNAAIVLFGSEPFSSALRMSNFKNYKYDWYWNKERGTGFQYSHHQPQRQIETISVFYKNPPFYDYQGEKLLEPVYHALPTVKSESALVKSKNTDENGNRIYKKYEYATKSNLLQFPRDTDKDHPTQKPTALLEYLILTYTQKGELVLDNTMGSGSTGVAAVNLDRNFIGIEKDAHYFEIAQRRIKDAQAQGHFNFD